MPIVVKCGSCGKTIKAAEKFAGKRVKCPGCQAVLAIPAAASAVPTPPRAAAPASQAVAAGLVADGFPIQQQAPTAQPAAGSLADLFDDDVPIRQEPQQAQPAAQAPANCPGCGTAVQAGAVLCVNCGYDFRTNARLVAKGPLDGTTAPKKKARRRSSASSSRVNQVLKGCGISAISVAIGAVIWYGIAMLTGMELGIIAWMLGGAAGVGMAVGCGENGTNGLTGFLAAVITFFGIFFARLAIVLTIIIPMALAAANVPDEFADDEVVVEQEFGDDMAPGDAESADESAQDAESGETPVAAEAMPGDEQPPLEDAAFADEFEMEEMPEVQFSLVGALFAIVVFFVMLMFPGIIQAIFVVLACATAFRVGMTGVVNQD